MGCTYKRKRIPWSDYVGCTYERKHLAGTDCVGCTCDRKQFRCIIVFFSSTVRISVIERSWVAHELILPSVCARRAYPRRFLGLVGRTPLSPSLTRRRFQMSSRKGVKNHLYSTCILLRILMNVLPVDTICSIAYCGEFSFCMAV